MSLRYAVLGIIQHKPQHGYEIKQVIEESFGDIWNVSYGQLYPTLKNLSDKGFVTKHKEKGQKSLEKNVYEITELGRNILNKWFSEMPKKVNITGKDEFSLLFLFLLLDGSEDVRNIALERQIDYFTSQKNKFTKMFENAKTSKTTQRVVIRRIILRIQAEIEWLKELQSNTF